MVQRGARRREARAPPPAGRPGGPAQQLEGSLRHELRRGVADVDRLLVGRSRAEDARVNGSCIDFGPAA